MMNHGLGLSTVIEDIFLLDTFSPLMKSADTTILFLQLVT